MRKVSRAKPVLPPDRLDCACTVIRQTAREVTRLYDEALAPAGLRITQYSLLANLDRHGDLPMTALAGVLAMDRTTLTRNLRPLERDGLLALRAAGSGRTKIVALSERGRRRLRDAFPYWQLAQERFNAALGTQPPPEFARLTTALRRMSG